MTLDLTQLVLFAIITTSLHWLIARSEIAKPLWSRTKGVLAKLLACPACSGFWLGGLVAGTGWVVPVTFVDESVRDIWSLHAGIGAILGVFVTPVFEGLMLWGLERSAIVNDDEDEGAVPAQPASQANSGVVTPTDNFLRKPK